MDMYTKIVANPTLKPSARFYKFICFDASFFPEVKSYVFTISSGTWNIDQLLQILSTGKIAKRGSYFNVLCPI